MYSVLHVHVHVHQWAVAAIIFLNKQQNTFVKGKGNTCNSF